jgi:polar amino acid transport system permease protein
MLGQIAAGIGATLEVTALALFLGSALGLPLAALRRSGRRELRAVAIIYTDLIRAIPPITWLFLIYFGLPQYTLRLSSMQAAALGLAVISSAYMAEIYRSGLLSIPRGQWEASTALGLGRLTALRHIITPQAFKVTLPTIAAYAIALLKDSALASTIGVHEITYQAGLTSRATHQGMLAFSIAGLIYIGMSFPLALAARRVDRVLRLKLEVA